MPTICESVKEILCVRYYKTENKCDGNDREKNPAYGIKKLKRKEREGWRERKSLLVAHKQRERIKWNLTEAKMMFRNKAKCEIR